MSLFNIIFILFIHLQIENFRCLEDTEGNIMNHNFRPIQPINDRIVWFNSNDYEMNDNSLAEDNLSNDKDNDVTIMSVKKRKNSGIKIKTNLGLIISLSIVTMLKIILP